MGQEYQPGTSNPVSHSAPATTITIAVMAEATRSQRVGIAGRVAVLPIALGSPADAPVEAKGISCMTS
jgi:hypothetical protein